jgi:hypothetical protein
VGETRQAQAPQAGTVARDEFGRPVNRAAAAPAAPLPDLPAALEIKPGTFVTVRVNDFLTTDRNQPGDAFTATLVKPVVVDGFVVADQGQTVAGRVVESVKGGRVKGVSRLGIQLTELALADGQQVPIQCNLIGRAAPTSMGRDAGAVAATTATGAMIGAAADWGRGAAIGAGAGAAAGIIGVLLTKGHPSVVDPEMVLTFRIDTPVTVNTARAPQAFRYVTPEDYQKTPALKQRPPRLAQTIYHPGYYTPVYDPWFWGPGFGPYWGPGYYGTSIWIGGGRGWHGHRHHR